MSCNSQNHSTKPHLKPFQNVIFFSGCLIGCTDKNNTCNANDIIDGQASALIDNQEASFDATWLKTGSAFQLNLDAINEEMMITIRLNQSDDGLLLEELSTGTFSLGNSSNGTATIYPSVTDPSFAAQSDNPGNFNLISFDGEILEGCFSFEGVDRSDSTIFVSEGSLKASKSPFNQ